jgi:outer membrane receptor protein involved in Fe transport
MPAVMAGQLACASLAEAAAPAAEGEASGALEEVVVTATRRTERLEDVPISVTAFSQEKLDAEGLHSIDDLTRLSPGVAFQRNGMSSAGNYNDEGSDINIRGVDSTAGTSTTGIYIDDTPIQTRHIGFGSINAFPALFDLDRVEVLRGPQGTLFGAGAEGGVVRFISPEPNLKSDSGYVRADGSVTDGGSPSYEEGAALGAPIIDDVLAFRVGVSYRRDGGWVDRTDYALTPPGTAGTPGAAATPTPSAGVTTQPNANWQETTTARLAVKWQVADSLEITPSIYYQRLYINDTAAYWIALSDAHDDVFRNGNALRNPSDDPFTLSAIKLKWDLGFASLFSNTAFYDRNQKAQSDYSQYLRATWASIGYVPAVPGVIPAGAPPFQLANTFPAAGDQGYALFEDDQRNFYEEIRLASTDTDARIVWNAGVFFSHLEENVPESIYDNHLNAEIITYTGGVDALCSMALPCPGGLIFNGPVDKVVDRQIALFGEANFKITETFKATVGLRVSKLDYSGSVRETGPFLGTTIVTQSSDTDKPVTPKAVLTWQPDHDAMVYVSASKGFRPGGPNVGVGDICSGNLKSLGLSQVPGEFSSDSLWSYELGSKDTFLEHTLQVNASLFYIDWNNIQQNVYLPACGEQFTANLGKARSEGGDIDVLYKPLEALTLDLAAAYTDARLTKTSCAGALTYVGAGVCSGAGGLTAAPIASNGDALLGAPWTFTSSAEYHFPQWQGRTPYFRLDYQHSTAQKSLLQGQDPHNALYDTTIPGLPIVNDLSGRAGLRFNGIDVSAYANNLTNSLPLMFESRDIAYTPTDTLYFGRSVRPRTIGLTATYRY